MSTLSQLEQAYFKQEIRLLQKTVKGSLYFNKKTQLRKKIAHIRPRGRAYSRICVVEMGPYI